MTRRVCVFTGTRAEYGLLVWLMREIQADPNLELQVLVSGSHLVREFGDTWRQIIADGFSIDAKVDMLLAADNPVAIVKSMGLGLIGFADALERLIPDILVVLGDRYEALAACEAALLLGIPVAHIHGGEITEGALDDSIRHAITKMSHLHFVASEDYRRRVIQLGERPEYVFNVGAPGLDAIKNVNLASIEEFEEKINFKLGKKNLIVTFHPVTNFIYSPDEGLQPLLDALDGFPEYNIVFTKANADAYGKLINDKIQSWVFANKNRSTLVSSLGQRLYYSAISLCDAVVGNSSSGIIEAPALQKPTINIGARQTGRSKARSIIDCGSDVQSISNALKIIQRDDLEFLKNINEIPYGYYGASKKIKNTISSISLKEIKIKKFHDIVP